MENNQNSELQKKLEEYFLNILDKMEEKFNNDYDTLRGISIRYTEMYHDYNENMIILLII